MGSGMRPSGRIRIEPPLSWLQFRDLNADSGYQLGSLKFKVNEKDRDDGCVIKTAVALRPDTDEIPWDFKEQIQWVIDRFPEHTFIGHFEMTGYEPGDPPWRLVVGSDRKVHEVQPVMTWPEVP